MKVSAYQRSERQLTDIKEPDPSIKDKMVGVMEVLTRLAAVHVLRS